jgi:hypothetical protein
VLNKLFVGLMLVVGVVFAQKPALDRNTQGSYFFFDYPTKTLGVNTGSSSIPVDLDSAALAGNFNGIYQQTYSNLGTDYVLGAAINFHAYQEVLDGGSGGGTARNFLGDLIIPSTTDYDGSWDHFNAVNSEFRLTTYRTGFYDTLALLLEVKGTRIGTVNTSGTTVSWVSGKLFYTLQGGGTITINGINYTISSVSSTTSMTLTGSAGTQSAVPYSVPNITNIVTGLENSVNISAEAAVKGFAVYSAQIDLQGTDLNPAYSAGYLLKSNSADNLGVRTGFRIAPDNVFPVSSAGTLFGATGGEVTHGVDFDGMTFSGKAFRSTDFSVDGIGQVSLTSIMRRTAAVGDLAISNNTEFTLGSYRYIVDGAANLLTMDSDGSVLLDVVGAGTAGGAITFINGWTINATDFLLHTNGVRLRNNAEPTCNLANSGAFVRVAGGAGVADTLRLCAKKADDTYAYVTVVAVP